MDLATSNPKPDEVISPELVLVDPELAQLARRQLGERPEWRPAPRLPAAATAAPVRPSLAHVASPPVVPRRTASRVAVAIGGFATAIPLLLLGAVLVGVVASEVRAQLVDDPLAQVSPSKPSAPRPPRSTTATTTATTTTTTTSAEPQVVPKRTTPPPAAVTPAPARRPPVAVPAPAPPKTPRTSTRASPSPSPSRAVAPGRAAGDWIPTKSEVEARTLVLLQERVALWVPAALLDSRTGLLVNNVHVVCRRVGRTPQFDCRLGVGRSPGREWLLSVVVARDGTEQLKWRGHAAAR